MSTVKLCCLLVFVLSIIICTGSLYAEMMSIHTSTGETISFDTGDIEQITFSSDVSVEDMAEIVSQIPIKFLKNYPNPFNPNTTISFVLNQAGNTEVEIFNVKGQKVKLLRREVLGVGTHSCTWDGRNDCGNTVASGVFFYRVSVNGNTLLNKMLMLK